MNDYYLVTRLIHIISATLLFGTGLGTAFYMWRADRSGDVASIVTVSRNVVIADWLFTMPAVIIQPVSGILLMNMRGYTFDDQWIITSLALYLFTGCCWLPVIWLQIKMRDLSMTAQLQGSKPNGDYRRYMRWWFWLGWPAFISVIIIFILMVYKNSLFL